MMKDTSKLSIDSIRQRTKAETPRFWKLVRRWMIGCSGLGVSLMAAKTQYTMAWLSETLCEHLIVVGAVGTAIASLTATDQYEPVAKPEEGVKPE